MAEGRRERTHAWRFEMKGHLRLRKNERKSITERNGDLVLLAGREDSLELWLGRGRIPKSPTQLETLPPVRFFIEDFLLAWDTNLMAQNL
ncbi:UNVERIFIED_CONTAM: hypothetical protein Scaly_0862100 [Sesamum calycinum]|uniref:Uncharacterized protein n=1 Tax=Sesamum calycinum TaxID=2727403 RepID=A0AAW2QV63_9LAMI